MDNSISPIVLARYIVRRRSLAVFGSLYLLFGALILTLTPMNFVARRAMALRSDRPAPPQQQTFGFMLVMCAFGALLICLGAGSVACRRWARSLLLCLNAMVGIGGLIVLGITAVFASVHGFPPLHSASHAPVSPTISAAIITAMIGALGVLYIIFPGLLALYYRSSDVKLTCEARDPVVRWTDRCPLPVLVFCVLLIVHALVAVPSFSGFVRGFPVFGIYLQGTPSRICWILDALFIAYSAWGFYRLNRGAWNLYTPFAIIFWASSCVTIYRLGLPSPPSAQPHATAIFHSFLLQHNNLLWLSGAFMVIYLGYLVYIRRFFTESRAIA